MAGAGSATVSGAGTPVAGPAGRDIFAEGLLEFLRPAVQQLDSHVHAVRCPRGEHGRGLARSVFCGGRGQERAESRGAAARVLMGLRIWESGGGRTASGWGWACGRLLSALGKCGGEQVY